MSKFRLLTFFHDIVRRLPLIYILFFAFLATEFTLASKGFATIHSALLYVLTYISLIYLYVLLAFPTRKFRTVFKKPQVTFVCFREILLRIVLQISYIILSVISYCVYEPYLNSNSGLVLYISLGFSNISALILLVLYVLTAIRCFSKII